MDEQEEQLAPPKIRIWRYLPILIVLGLAVHLLVPQITTLEHSWSVVKELTWWAVALAVVAQVLSYLGSGFILHAILRSNRQKLSATRGALISMASASIGLVAGGWVGGAAATYGWIRRISRDGNTAALAGMLPSLLNNAVLVAVALAGTIYLLIVHDLSKTQLIEFGIILLALGLLTGGVLAALRFPATATRLAIWAGSGWAKLRRKSFEPVDTAASVERFVHAWQSLRDGKWLHPLLGAMANIGFDMLTLYFVFLAAGHNVSPEVILAGYGLPLILGKMAFLFPGGIGVIEGSMVAIYDSLKIPDPVSVVVILGYRLISFWIPTLLGFLAAAYLSRQPAKIAGRPA